MGLRFALLWGRTRFGITNLVLLLSLFISCSSYQISNNNEHIIYDLDRDLYRTGSQKTRLKSLLHREDVNDYEFEFAKSGRNAQISPGMMHKISLDFHIAREATFLANINQYRDTNSTLFLFSWTGGHRTTRLMELRISTRHKKQGLRFFYQPDYVSDTTRLQRKRISLYPALQLSTYHKLAFSIIDSSRLDVYLNCTRIDSIVLPQRTPTNKMFRPRLQMYIGQHGNTDSANFEGKMSDIKLVFGSNGYRVQCSKSDKPTNPLQSTSDKNKAHTDGNAMTKQDEQKTQSDSNRNQLLDDDEDEIELENNSFILALKKTINDVKSQISVHDKRLKELEKCECVSKCQINNRYYDKGGPWKVHPCKRCFCKVDGGIHCEEEKCPYLPCSNPISVIGKCCKICPTNEVNVHSALFKMVMNLTESINMLQIQLLNHEDRLQYRESCECVPKCVVGNITYPKGAKWTVDACKSCSCEDNGMVKCTEESCPVLSCSNPISIPGKCCGKCPSDCISLGQTLSHGQIFKRNCMTCECYDGNVDCAMKEVCPQLSCRRKYKPPGSCCYQCRVTNYCANQVRYADKECHPSAICTNLEDSFTCQCPPGFTGDGFHCQDIDECTSILPPCLVRGLDEECVNTPGSYRCQCPAGYSRRADNENCRKSKV